MRPAPTETSLTIRAAFVGQSLHGRSRVNHAVRLPTIGPPQSGTSELREYPGRRLQHDGTEGFGMSPAHGVDRAGSGRHLQFPRDKPLIWRLLSQQDIPLPQRPLVTPPHRQEVRFHVEHTPIEHRPAHIGTARYQLMRTRFKTTDRAQPKQIGQLPDLGIVDASPPTHASSLDAQSLRHFANGTELSKHSGTVSTTPNQNIAATRSKAAPITEQMHSLKN